jgi:hypothetical protein
VYCFLETVESSYEARPLFFMPLPYIYKLEIAFFQLAGQSEDTGRNASILTGGNRRSRTVFVKYEKSLNTLCASL